MMNNILDDTKKRNIIFVVVCIVLLFLAVGVRIYWSNQKEAYHVDEVSSYHFIGGGSSMMPHLDAAFQDTWHDGAFFSDYVTIDADERYDFSRITDKTAQDVHPPLYYWILHLSVILVDDGDMNLWGGIALNIITFILSTILLYFLSLLVLKNKILSVGTCVLWGFSIAAISDAIFLRMYGVLTTAVIAFTLVLYYYIRAEKPTWLNYIGIIFATIAGLLTHYFFIFLFIPLSLYVFFRLLIRKTYRQLLIYTLLSIGSITIAYVLFPSARDHLFSSGRSKEMVDKVTFPVSEKITFLVERLKEFNVIFNEQVFFGVLVIVGILLLAMIIKLFIKRKYVATFPELTILTASVSILWVIIVLYAAPYANMRYVAPVLPLLVLSLVGAINYLFLSDKIKYGTVIFFILATFFQIWHGDINYISEGSYENWKSIVVDHAVPVLIISSEKRAYAINAINPYLTHREQIYVTTVERSSDLISRGDLDLHENTDKCVYLFIEKSVIDKLDFSEYGTRKFLFSHAYYDIYELIIDSN